VQTELLAFSAKSTKAEVIFMTLGRILAGYRLRVTVLTTLGSFVGLLYGLMSSSVLSGGVWPSPLREQALALAAISSVVAIFILWMARRRHFQFLPALMVAAGIVAVAAFGFAGFFGAVAVVISCIVLGHTLELALGNQRSVLSVNGAVVGLAVLMLLLALTGALLVPMVPVLWGIVIFVAFGSVSNRTLWRRYDVTFRRLVRIAPSQPPPWGTAIPLSLGLFSIFFFAAQVALPERGFDALAMHLLVPSQILTFGKWDLDPNQYAFAVMPVTVDYVYTYAYLLGGEMAARLFNLLVLFGILAQIAGMVRQYHGRTVAGLAVLLFLAIPTALNVTASLFIENTVALLTITAVRLLLQQNSENYRFALSGLAIVLGALCAAKLHGVVIAVPLFALAVLGQDYGLTDRGNRRQIFVLASVCVALGSLPYMVALIKTGNPIFPLQNAYFQSPYWPLVNFEDKRWTGHWSLFLIYRMTFMTTSYLEARPGAMGFAFVALLAPGAMAGLMRPQRQIVACLVCTVLFGVIVTSQSQYVRYLYPVFPLMVVICAYGIGQLSVVKVWRRAIQIATVSVAALGIFMLPSGGGTLEQANLAAVFSPEQRTVMLRTQVPHRLVNAAINAIGAKPRVVYATVAPYGAFLDGTPIYVEWYNTALWMALDKAKATEDVNLIIANLNADFIVTDAAINPDHYMAARHAKVVAFAQAHGDRVATIGGLYVYKLRP
jgi:hypothetical protein